MDVILSIDGEQCVGYGECVGVDPDAVELDDQGCARLLVTRIDVSRARALCAACPTSAISLQEG